MLRYRELSVNKGCFRLISRFIPQTPEDNPKAVGVSIDFLRKVSVLDVFRPIVSFGELPAHRFPLPDLPLIREEVEYLFNLVDSLTHALQEKKEPQDFEEISDFPRRDQVLDDLPF